MRNLEVSTSQTKGDLTVELLLFSHIKKPILLALAPTAFQKD